MNNQAHTRTPAQLELFAWETERTGEACSLLAALDCDAALKVFKEVIAQYPGNTIAVEGAVTAFHWGKVLAQCGSFGDTDTLEYLFLEIQAFDYGKDPTGSLKAALTQRLANLMRDRGVFFIRYPVSVGDLYMEVGEWEMAEQAFQCHLDENPQAAMIRCRLADAQFMQGNRADAGRNYTLALLHGPDQVQTEKIASGDLKNLIGLRGAAMAPAYGWIAGTLPLPDESEIAGASADSTALTACRLLAGAGRARTFAEKVACRKALKEYDPVLFELYMKRLG